MDTQSPAQNAADDARYAAMGAAAAFAANESNFSSAPGVDNEPSQFNNPTTTSDTTKKVKAVPKAAAVAVPKKVAGDNLEEDNRTADDVELTATLAQFGGFVLDVTKEAAESQKVLKLAKIANVGGITTVLVGTLADAYLTTHIDPKTGKPYVSHVMAGTNLGVTVVAISTGGVGGVVVEVSYILVKINMNMEEKHPELIHDNPLRGFSY
jgi:hypothetical protein